MKPIRIKICGITRPQDAQLAAQLGADAIGLVFFAGSKRCVTIAQAQAQDIVLIAGKGHETYQDVQGVKHHFSDFEVAEKALAERR